MLKIPNAQMKEFNGRFETHRVNIAACNMYVSMAALVGKNPVHLDRQTYREIFLDALSDIELESSPTDAFIPSDTNKRLFDVNRLAKEYIEITKRIPMSLFTELLGPTSALTILVKNKPEEMDFIYDDIFRHFSMFKYMDMINMIRLNTVSNYTPIIEHIVTNITLDQWKDYLKTDKVNEKKYAKVCEDIIFNPDIASMEEFYQNNENVPNKFSVVNLMMRLSTNTCYKTDRIFVLGVYMILLAAMKDFSNQNVEPSPCSKYVSEVLSIL